MNDELERCVADLRAIIQAERDGAPEPLRRRHDPRAAEARLEAGSVAAGPSRR